jgi:rRNA maturation endonuclease Nob1
MIAMLRDAYKRPDHVAVAKAPESLFYQKRLLRAPRCEYCNNIFSDDKDRCRSCGAPR